MTNLKPYEDKIIIRYKDINWEFSHLLTPKKNKSYILKAINNNKFIEVEWIILKVDNIIKIEDYLPQSDIDLFISLQKKDVRDKIKEREREKKQAVWRWFESVDEIKKWLGRKWIKYIDIN